MPINVLNLTGLTQGVPKLSDLKGN